MFGIPEPFDLFAYAFIMIESEKVESLTASGKSLKINSEGINSRVKISTASDSTGVSTSKFKDD